MKLRDAARCGKAAEAMVDRINAAIEKLKAREAAVLKAIESLEAVNPALEKAFQEWNDLAEELDPDGEISMPVSSVAPSFDLPNLTEAITGAFSDAREELEAEVGSFEEVVQNAADYEEEPEEEEDDENTEEFVFTCDHPGCKAEIEAPSEAQAESAARAAGWDIEDEKKSWCPKHVP